MNPYRFLHQLPDPDVGEVQEWVDSLDGLPEVHHTSLHLVDHEGLVLGPSPVR